ncbi:hypothetical protein CLV62_11711 [Dysgonomonas alginatilytica]|uniref:GDSL-like lipase/acylhydrolase family protein n=1 Tax=Dysgonomonas alginatilytica TaxID=1605892 RepID=A0A2V3PLX2_9BACT|nr:hypothetical protein [Dysgonomonas alginatilytica]PXV62795.1 hypothetical protein CLV62_11711 [Dysgonomonas alginatilytica]
MVKKTLLSFFIIFIAYTIIVTFVTDSHRFVSEHQWQDNQIKAQEYLYSDTDSVENIIVGSSLADRLIIGYLPNVYNLSMGGLGIFDGLQTLTRKGVYPQKIFIEMNKIDRKASVDFTTSLNNPVMTFLRKYFIPIRDGKQPMGFIAIPYGQKITAYGIYITQTILHSVAGKIVTREHHGIEEVDMLTRILPRLLEEESQMPNASDLEKDAQNLKYYVDILEKNNVTVVFFEMPIQHELCGLNKPTAIRNQFYRTFPRDKYQYIDMPDCSNYGTTDGLHLDGASAEKYTLFFKRQMDSLK